MKILKKIKDFISEAWYRSKWGVVLVVALVILITFAIVQLFGKEDYDVHMMYIGPAALTGKSFEKPEKEIAELFSDNNGDGKKLISYVAITAYTKENTGDVVDYKYRNETERDFQTQIASGDAFVFIADREFYEKMKDLGILARFSDILDEEDIPKATFDDMGVMLKDIDISEMTGFKALPRESVLCFRRSPAETALNYGRTMDDYRHNLEFFTNIIKYKREPELKYKKVKLALTGLRYLETFGINKLDDLMYEYGKKIDEDMSLQVDYAFYSDREKGEPDETKVHDAALKISTSGTRIAIVDRPVYEKLAERNKLDNIFEAADEALKYKKDIELGVYLHDIPCYGRSGFCYMEQKGQNDDLIVCVLKTEHPDELSDSVLKRMLYDGQ